MKLAFLDLPDDKVDLISTARRANGVDLVLVANADSEALALRIAEVLQIPRSSEPLDLLALKPDRVALPSLEVPSAAALLRAGISPTIFVPFADLQPLLAAAMPEAEPEVEAVLPIEDWDAEPELAETGHKLEAIRDALALSEDRQRLFREVLALAVSETGADSGSLMVLDEDEGELRIAFADGLSTDTVRSARQKLGEGIAGTVAQNGTPLIINERVLDPRYRGGRERPRIASAMSAPIKLDGRVIGVLNVSSDRPGVRFQESDLGRLTEIGGQISAILDRVVRRTRSDLDAIEFRARQILERAFQGDEGTRVEHLHGAATRLAEQLGARAFEIYIADPHGATLTVIRSGTAPGDDGTVPKGAGLVGRAAANGETVILAGRATRPAERGHASSSSVNLIVLPIAGAALYGALLVERAAFDEPDADSLAKVLGRIAGYLASLIEVDRRPRAGAGAAESTRAPERSLSGLLSDIAPRLMVARDIESLAIEAVGALRALFPTGLASVRLVDPDGDLIVRTAYDGPDEERDAALDEDAATADGVLSGHAPFLERGAGVPIRTSDRTVGALGVILPLAAAYEPGLADPERGALEKVALYVSIAWEHVKSQSGNDRETHDAVTGLLGGAGLEARIQDEVKRAERYHDRFLLTLCAIAEFGRLEAQHGSAFTDRLLREFGAALARNVREVDTVARIGEGRFAVLSPETDKDSGALLKRLDLLVPRLACVTEMSDPTEIRLIGRQYAYPDEIATGGELLALIRGDR